MTTPYERLLAEEWPTGTFGRAHDPRPADGPWTPQEQARHLAELLAALTDQPTA